MQQGLSGTRLDFDVQCTVDVKMYYFLLLESTHGCTGVELLMVDGKYPWT